MKMIFFILSVINTYTNLYSQSKLSFDIGYPIDTHFVYKHGADSVIIKEYNDENNMLRYDTIYSCKKDRYGNITEEFYGSNMPVTLKCYKYDSLNNIGQSYEYCLSENDGSYQIEWIKSHIYEYFSNDSIKKIQHYLFQKKIVDSINPYSKEHLDIWFNLQNDKVYSNEWKWSYEGYSNYSYYPNNLKKDITYFNQNEAIATEKFVYDTLKRITRKEYCNYAIKRNGKRRQSSCQIKEETTYTYYNDSVIVFNSFNNSLGYQKSKKNYKYDATNKLIHTDIIEHLYEMNQLTTNSHSIDYQYNNFGKLTMKKVFEIETADEIIYRYYRK